MATEPSAEIVHSPIMNQKVGDAFGGIYYVDSAFVKLTAQQKKYTDMTLRDKSGSRNVKFWGTINDLDAGDFVAIIAHVEDYQGTPSVIATEMELVKEPEDLADYIPTFDGLKEWEDKLAKLINEVVLKESVEKQETCTLLLGEVFNPSSGLYQKFLVSPSSAFSHYGRIGGLLVNTVSVADSSLLLAEQHGFSSMEKVLVVTAALLYRIGAVDAYAFEHCMPKMTKKGMLLGVNNLTFNRLSVAIRKVTQEAKTNNKSISQESVLRVLHAVTASDEKAIKPMTKEAMALAAMVKSDVEMTESFDFMANDLNVTDEFTAFDPRRGVRYYRS
jgi:23S rRNA maturation-related 3'-5' exoribonuclease YhaM